MKINKFTSIFYLLLLRLDIVLLINCDCDVQITFANMKLEVVPQNQGACITGYTYQVHFVKSTFGVFSGNDVINFKCNNEASNEIKITMDTQISYYILKNTNPEQYMMIISDMYTTDVSISSFVYKEVYHQYDFECFHKERTDIDTKHSNFITVTKSKYFGSDTFKLKCYWFSVMTTAEKGLTYNNKPIKIKIKPKNNEDSPIMSNLVQCKKDTPSSVPPSVTKRVTMVTQNQEIFCINPTTHFMEKLEIDSDDSSIKNTKTGDTTSEFCVLRDTDNARTCFQMGKNFRYAIFSSTLSGTKLIVMKHFETNDPNSYDQVSTYIGKVWSVAMDSLMCVSNINFKDKFMKTIGIYDQTDNKQCFLTNDLMWDHQANYTHDQNDYYIQLNGCKASPVVPISTSPIIKYNSTGVACLPYGNTIVKRIVPNSLQITPTNICPIQYTSTICYKVSENVKYAIISHETTKTDTLIVKYDIINVEGQDEYIYDETYYMDEMVCMKKTLIKNFETVKNEAHFYHYSDTIICFIVDDMNANDKIQITGSVGCDSREISVQPSTPRGSTMENLKESCADILTNSRTDKSILIKSSEILTKCLKVTCTQKIYAFSPTEFEKERGRLIDCSLDSKGCVDTEPTKSLIYLVKNQKKNLKFYVSSSEPSFSFTKTYYSPDYYNSDVVCILESKITEEQYKTIFQVKSSEYLCSVVKEIPSNIETITINPTSNCPNQIKFHKHDVNPNANSPSFDEICAYVITPSSSKIIEVSHHSLEDCIKRTCTTVHSIVELSKLTNHVVYKLSTCGATDDTKNACIKKVVSGGLMTVTSINTGDKLLYTKVSVGDIPDDFYYSSFYGDEDFVCFKKSNVENKDQIKLKNAHIESSDRLCIFVKFLTPDDDVILKLEVTKSCYREIKLSSGSKETEKTEASAFSRKCNEFHLIDSSPSKILDANINEIMDCITKLCIDLEYQIMKNGEIKNCRSAACDKDDGNTKYFKTMSRYNKKVHYIIPIAQQKQDIITSRVNNFYKSDFYQSDIVCYKKLKLREEDKVVVVPRYVAYNTEISCYIVKEMTENKKIELTVRDGCTRTIHFHHAQFSVNHQKPSTNLDSLCEEFGKITHQNQPIVMTLDNLKTCVKHFCLTPLFVTHESSIKGDHAATFTECTANSDSCILEISSYDYAKIQNSYTAEIFYVQNSEKRKLTIEDGYFYPSPYFKTEVMCIKADRVTTNNLDPAYSKSYDLGEFKCIILNEIDNTNPIKIDQDKSCKRDILVRTLGSGENIARTVDAIICQDLLGTNVDSTKVLSITYQILSICMTHTCSNVLSRVQLQDATPLIHSSITECSSISDGQNCIQNNVIYDLIRVEQDPPQPHRYFRFFESSDLNKYTPKKIEFYADEYYQGNVICFKTEHVEEMDSWKTLPGVFYEESRICVIAKELNRDIVVKYKLSDRYIQQIAIKHSSSDVKPFDNGDETKRSCEIFFNKNEGTQQNYVELAKNLLIECVTKTRSYVYFLVDVKEQDISSAQKKLKMCNKHKDITECLSNIEEYDALKIKSPYRDTPFYVRSPGLNQLNQDSFDSFYYKTTYYSDDVVCIPNNRIQDPSNPNLELTGFLQVNDVTCVVVRDVDTQQSIEIKMLNKCTKRIYFVRFGYEPDSDSNDQCRPFYASKVPEASMIMMSLTSLLTCIAASCSKLKYFITEQTNPDIFVKKSNECDAQQTYGSIACAVGHKKYFMAKVERATGSAVIYVKSDTIDEIKMSTYDSYFYSPTYYKDQVVCFHKNRLTPPTESSIKPIEIGHNNFACIIIVELTKEISVTLKTKDECDVRLTLNPTQSNPVSTGEDSSDSCKPLYNYLHNEPPIKQMTSTVLKSCILQTCTKIISYVKREDQNEGYKHAKNVLCETGFGKDSCLSGTNYDFAIVMNSYLPKPIMFRSFDYDDVNVTPSPIKSFDHSVYFKDDVVCYLSELILDLPKIVSFDAVYSHSKRTCIIGSKVEKELEFTLRITNKCNRTISVLNATTSGSPHSKKNKDVECSKYYDNTQTLLVQSKQQMLDCVEHTCATVEFLNQSISKTICENSDTKCDKTQEFTYAIISNEYLTSSMLVISEDVKSKWLELAENMNKYESIYPVGEISCFKQKIFTKNSETLKTYQNTDLNLLCVHPKSTDPEFLLTIEQGSTDKLNLLSPTDNQITSLASKKFKFVISTVRPGTKNIVEVFTLEQNRELKNKLAKVNSINDLETCTSNQPKKELNKDFIDESIVPDIYAFDISANSVLKKPIVFLLKNHSACFGELEVDSSFQTSGSISDEFMRIHHFDCIFLSKEYLTIRLNSELMEEPLNTDVNCLEETQLKAKCDIVYEYNKHITLCYISKSKDSDEDSKPSPVYIMIKKNGCFVPKIMKYKRAAMCHIEETGITVKIVDFDEIGEMDKEERKSTASAKIQPSTMGYFALFVIAVILVNSFIFLTRDRKTRENKEFV